MIVVLTSSCQLRIKYINLLMTGMKFDLCLAMSKVFYKVWHESLIFKLNPNDLSGNLLSTLLDFSKPREK